MSFRLRNAVFAAGISLFAAFGPASAYAVNWTNNASSNWDTGTNWAGGSAPDAVDAIADFTTINIGGTRTITLNGANTIVGTLNLGDTDGSNNYVFSPSASTSNSLTFDVSSGTAKIIKLTGRNDQFTGPVILNDTLEITIEQGVVTNTTDFDGTITGAGGVTIKNASVSGYDRRVIFDVVAKNYDGATTIEGGNLRLANVNNMLPHGMGKGSVTIGAAGRLELNQTGGGTQTINGLNGLAGAQVYNNDSIAGAVTNFVLGDGDANGSYGGTITNRTDFASVLNVQKIGAGTQIFSGNSDYSGTTTVTAGSLIVDGNHTGVAAYTVGVNGLLGGKGIISAGVNLFGEISPGTGISAETLTIGGLTLQDGATSTFQLENTSGLHEGSGNDLFNITGALTVALGLPEIDVQIEAIGGGLLATEGSWTLANYNSLNPLSLPTFNVTGVDTTNYIMTFGPVPDDILTPLGSGSIVLTLTVVPEPGSVVMGLFGLAGLGLVARRRAGKS